MGTETLLVVVVVAWAASHLVGFCEALGWGTLALTRVASASEILGVVLGTETLLVVVVVAWAVSCLVGFCEALGWG